jgi:hypothetical protein
MIQFHLVDIDDLASVKEDHVNRFFCSFREVIEKWLCFFSQIELTEQKVTQFHQPQAKKVVSRLWILASISEISERRDETVRRSFGEFDFLG